MEDDFLVCRAVKLGFLSREKVPEKVAEKHRGRVFILHIMPKSVNNEDTTPLFYSKTCSTGNFFIGLAKVNSAGH